MNKWRNNHSMDNFLLDYQLLPFVMSPTTATTPNTNLFIPSLFGGSPACPFMLTAAATAVTATATSVPPQHRKLFIGGLNHETTDEQLRDYYSRWGHVVDCIVIRDPVTRDSRGFGFVTFSMPEMADAAMADKPHTMGGKIVDPKRAIPREQMQNVSTPPAFLDVEPPSECKLILSGIHWDFHTVDALRDYFVRFGEVEQVEIMGHPRGYGFVVFEGRSSVDKCLALSSSHIINGRKIEARGSENSDVHPPFSSLLPIMGRGSRNDHHQYPHNYNKYHSPEHGGYRKQQQHHGGYRGIGTHYGSGGSLGSQGSQSHSPAESMQSDPRESSSPQPESKTGISTPGSKSHDTPSPSSLTFQMSPNC